MQTQTDIGPYDFGSGDRADLLQAIHRSIHPNPETIRDLLATAFLLAELDHLDEPNLGHYQLMSDVQAAVAAQLQKRAGFEKISELSRIIGKEFGFEGDRETYDDMRNADLFSVMERRRGLPVALGLIYIQCARAAGLQAHGISFPAHFLIRIDIAGEQAVVDPFNDGEILSAANLRDLLKRFLGPDAELLPDHYTSVSDRDILMRLQNNILTRSLQEEDYVRSHDILERMIAMSPENAGLYRETGAVCLRMGDLYRALDCFNIYYNLADDPAAKEKAAKLVTQLQKVLQDQGKPH